MYPYLNIPLSAFLKALAPLIVFVVIFIVGFIFRRLFFGFLVRWAKQTKTDIDDVIMVSLRASLFIWFLILGLYLASKVSNLSGGMAVVVGRIIVILAIFSVTVAVANIMTGLIKAYSSRFRIAVPINSLTQNIVRIVIFGSGILVILNSLGISITPILATLGVGGLAVALGLQDTLSNLFSGFHIVISRQVKVGDYVKLDSGEEGYVTDITLRTTQIRTLPNNVVLVPNERLTKAIVTNYYLPEKEMAVLVNVGVHYNSDLEKVEKITCQVAKEVMCEVSGGVPEFEPFIRYHTFGDFSINFTVILRAREFTDQYLIKHEFIKRLHKRYLQEGIVIPYPIRAINYEQEKAK